MNALTKVASQTQSLALPEDQAIRVLQNSLYPGARPESVALVLAWCRATGRDPMKKPIHIVPMYVKDAQTGQGGMRDVLMPGIGTYRTDAADTGQYVGKSEPEFGPEVTRTIDGVTVTFPQWCKISVMRLIAGQERRFTATEYWLENYASGKEKKGVNDMWRKRPYGQLAKCSESQALRMAFPDQTGNTNTSEEMEGKSFEGTTLDARPEPEAPRTAIARQPAAAELIPELEQAAAIDGAREWATKLIGKLGRLPDSTALMRVVDRVRQDRDGLREHRPDLSAEVEAAFSAAHQRLMPQTPGDDASAQDEAQEDEGLPLRHKPTPSADELDDEIPF